MVNVTTLHDGEMHRIGEDFTPNISTIAFSLSHINRFCGHVGAYSVAQHCVLVSRVLEDEYKLAGLLHDASEAYIGDVISPVKCRMPDYKILESHYFNIINTYFTVDVEHDLVKEADLRMLATEAESFGLELPELTDVIPYDFMVERWTAVEAEEQFLLTFDELTNRNRSYNERTF